MAVRFRIPRLLYAALAALALAACTIPISYYDGTTYKTLTDLKVDATMLVGSFDSVSVKENAPAIAGTRVRLLKALEYEKGKGKDNKDTAEQLELLLSLYDGAVADYRASGPNPRVSDYRERAVQLGQAFDIAISTEAAKNRDK
jgi:hypothetical protein